MRKAFEVLRARGFCGLLKAGYRRVVSDRLQYYPHCKPLFESRVGLEIGGPSAIFGRRGCIPVYPVAARMTTAPLVAVPCGKETSAKVRHSSSARASHLVANTSQRRAISSVSAIRSMILFFLRTAWNIWPIHYTDSRSGSVFRGGSGFSDTGLSGFRARARRDRRNEIHEEAETQPFRGIQGAGGLGSDPR